MKLVAKFICALMGHSFEASAESETQTCKRCDFVVNNCKQFGHLFVIDVEEKKRSCKRCGLVQVRCGKCNGDGCTYEPGQGDSCGDCGGSGSKSICEKCAGQSTMCNSCAYACGELEPNYSCESCGGSGRSPWRRCEECKGMVWISVET